MNRRTFLAALAGVAIAPRILEQLHDNRPPTWGTIEGISGKRDAYEVYYRFYDVESLRPWFAHGRIINLSAH